MKDVITLVKDTDVEYEENDLLQIKTNNIYNLIRDFVFVTKDQVVEYMDGKAPVSNRILNYLVKKRKIKVTEVDVNGKPCEYTSEIDMKSKSETKIGYQKALWLYLFFRKNKEISSYVVGANTNITMSFESDGTIYDIIYIPFDMETITVTKLHMVERYLSPEETNELHRIVILKNESQLKELESLKYDIKGLEEIYTVSTDGNIVLVKSNV